MEVHKRIGKIIPYFGALFFLCCSSEQNNQSIKVNNKLDDLERNSLQIIAKCEVIGELKGVKYVEKLEFFFGSISKLTNDIKLEFELTKTPVSNRYDSTIMDTVIIVSFLDSSYVKFYHMVQKESIVLEKFLLNNTVISKLPKELSFSSISEAQNSFGKLYNPNCTQIQIITFEYASECFLIFDSEKLVAIQYQRKME
jgi:hypothetical protein